MPRLAQGMDCITGCIFVRQESSHDSRVAPSRRNRIDALLFKDLAGVMKAGGDVLGLKVGIVRQNLLVGPTFGQQINDEFNGDASAADKRLAGENAGVDYDAIVAVRHRRLLYPNDTA